MGNRVSVFARAGLSARDAADWQVGAGNGSTRRQAAHTRSVVAGTLSFPSPAAAARYKSPAIEAIEARAAMPGARPEPGHYDEGAARRHQWRHTAPTCCGSNSDPSTASEVLRTAPRTMFPTGCGGKAQQQGRGGRERGIEPGLERTRPARRHESSERREVFRFAQPLATTPPAPRQGGRPGVCRRSGRRAQEGALRRASPRPAAVRKAYGQGTGRSQPRVFVSPLDARREPRR